MRTDPARSGLSNSSHAGLPTPKSSWVDPVPVTVTSHDDEVADPSLAKEAGVLADTACR